jgi:hypothetical protein
MLMVLACGIAAPIRDQMGLAVTDSPDALRILIATANYSITVDRFGFKTHMLLASDN